MAVQLIALDGMAHRDGPFVPSPYATSGARSPSTLCSET
jgi:hypothetical protein